MKVISSRESKHNGLHRTFSVFFVLLFNSLTALLWTGVSSCDDSACFSRENRMKVRRRKSSMLIVLPRLRFLSCQLRLPVTILVSVSRTLLLRDCRQIYLRASSFRKIPASPFAVISQFPWNVSQTTPRFSSFSSTYVLNYF